jgi:invasion protein IalB
MKKTLFAVLLASVSVYSLAADKQQVTVSLTSASSMVQGHWFLSCKCTSPSQFQC